MSDETNSTSELAHTPTSATIHEFIFINAIHLNNQEAVAVTTAIQEEILTEMIQSGSGAVNMATVAGRFSRDQLLYLFNRFTLLTSQPEVKKRIADAVHLNNQEAVAVTTAIQEEIFTEMGIDATIGIASLGKINTDYENDQDLMIHFYDFVSREEMACEEAELGEVKFAERVDELHKLQGQQLEMLKVMRKFTLVEQSEILQKIHQKLEETNFPNPGVVMSSDEIEEIVPRCMK